MWPVLVFTTSIFGVATFVYLVHYVHKWMNPKWCNNNSNINGVLPPGSMGIPLIGESLHLFFASPSLDLHPFIKNRLQKYGPIFKTNIIGQSTIVSADPKVNHFLLLQEGRLVEAWYTDTFSKLLTGDGDRITEVGEVHRYVRSLVLNHFGAEAMKAKLLTQIQEMVCTTLHCWSQQHSVELKHAVSSMVFKIGAEVIFSDDGHKFPESVTETLAEFSQLIMSFPLNIPGTKFHKSLKDRMRLLDTIREKFRKRRQQDHHHHDLVDQTVQDLNSNEFLSEDFLVQLIFVVLFASTDSSSSVLSLALKLVAENPSVMDQLQVEHEEILGNRQKPTSSITWDEYKSMTFTRHVINEALRISSIAPGIMRRAIKDFEVNGYRIPSGWTILIASSAQHLNPLTFEDPTAFNPWRWKELDSSVASMNFMPFGWGGRQCAGAEFSKALFAVFFHVLATNYRLTLLKSSNITRSPLVNFGDGIHVRVSKK